MSRFGCFSDMTRACLPMKALSALMPGLGITVMLEPRTTHLEMRALGRSLLKRYVPSSRIIALSTSLRRSADPSNDRLRVHASGG